MYKQFYSVIRCCVAPEKSPHLKIFMFYPERKPDQNRLKFHWNTFNRWRHQ